jgi:hypothetical protein
MRLYIRAVTAALGTLAFLALSTFLACLPTLLGREAWGPAEILLLGPGIIATLVGALATSCLAFWMLQDAHRNYFQNRS